jgi:t-SNARE complex subunit (syntaxin)
MESIAVDIKHNLAAQGAQLHRIDQNLNAVSADASRANQQLGQIKRARATNRFILYGVLATIAVAMVMIIAMKLV